MLKWLFGDARRVRKLEKELAATRQQLEETTESLNKTLDENKGLKLEIMELKGQKRQDGALYADARPLAPETPFLKTPDPVAQKSKQFQSAAKTVPTGRATHKHTTEHHYHNDDDSFITGVAVGSMLHRSGSNGDYAEEVVTSPAVGDTDGNDTCGGGDDGGCD